MDNYQNYVNLGEYGNEPEEKEEEFDSAKVRHLINYILEHETLSLTAVLALSQISEEIKKA